MSRRPSRAPPTRTTRTTTRTRPSPPRGESLASTVDSRQSTAQGEPFVAVGLGGNQGDVKAAFRLALRLLAPHASSKVVSPLYRTEAIGPAQSDFWNAAAGFRTRLRPEALLDLLQSIESLAGRRRDVETRWGPRPLDLDLLLYGRIRLASERLTVPHLRLAERRFVLAPLSDLCPRRVVPGLRRTVATLLQHAPEARVVRAGRLHGVGPWSNRMSR